MIFYGANTYRGSGKFRCKKLRKVHTLTKLKHTRFYNFTFKELVHASQGVVTFIRPVEPFVTGIKIFDTRKFALIA